MLSNIEKLQSKIPDSCTGAVITDDINRRYFTGMKSSAGTLLVFPEKAYLIIDFRYIEKARNTVKNCEVILQEGGIYRQINKIMTKHNAKSVLIDDKNCTVSQLNAFKQNLKAKVISDNTLSKAITQIRTVKTGDEINKIIEAQRIAEKGFEHMLDFIRPGRTEREIQLELDYFMLTHGAEALSFDTIALSGANTSLPHGVPGDKEVQKGEFVLMDFGAVVDGYHSDMTRTVCVGQPTEEMEKVYGIVLQAQLAALDKLKAGIKGSGFDKIARDIIESEGYGDNFGHSLGHGVGVEIHEAPTASPNNDNILLENSIITVEPGIYLPGKFGVRIEDFAVVKSDGCVNLTKAEKNLIKL